MEECLICQEIAGTVAVPGGQLPTSPEVAAIHVPPLNAESVYLGYLMVCPRRHAEDFAALSSEEAAAVGVEIGRWSQALRGAGAERVYVAVVGHHVAHLHVHLLPRWPETPADVAWHAVDEWPGARRGGFEEAASFAIQLRELYPNTDNPRSD